MRPKNLPPKKTIALSQVFARLRPVIDSYFPGMLQETPASDSLYVNCERAWGVDANLRVSLRYSDDGFKLEVSGGWSSSKLSPATMRAAATVHAQMADLACLLEAMIAGLPEIVINELEEEKP